MVPTHEGKKAGIFLENLDQRPPFPPSEASFQPRTYLERGIAVPRETEAGRNGRATIIYHKGETWGTGRGSGERKEINNEECANAARITTVLKGRSHVSTAGGEVFSRGQGTDEKEGVDVSGLQSGLPGLCRIKVSFSLIARAI